MTHLQMLLAVLLALCFGQAPAQDLPTDIRFCGVPERTATGKIKRSTAAKAAFARMHPCPATGQVTGSCPGWAIDHQVPLACGGCDAPHNMQWLPLELKSCKGRHCKDRWERRVYETTIPCR